MADGEFKTCRFCQEKIRASAIKCRFCGEFLESGVLAPSCSYIDVPGRVVEYTEVAPKRNQVSYLARHWRGDLPLRDSFWLNGTGMLLLLALCFSFAAGFFGQGIFSTTIASGLYVLGMAVFSWHAVGVWRSSANHVERGGKQQWAIRARIALTAAGATAAASLAASIAPRTFLEISALAYERKDPNFQLWVLPGQTEIAFEGAVRAGAAECLQELLHARPQIKSIRLNSTGGGTREAIQMAQLVSGCELTTHVQEQCLGAAALVFIAGQARLIESGARIGFDQVDDRGVRPSDREELEGQALDIFREAGIVKTFANRALTAPHDQMWFPSIEEMRAAGVETGNKSAESSAILVSRAGSSPDR